MASLIHRLEGARIALVDVPIRFFTFMQNKPYARIALVFSFFTLLFLVIYLPGSVLVSSDDHFFHFRFAAQMQSQGFFASFSHFSTIYFSKMTGGTYYVYYNFLFYLVILPFSYISPLYTGIKLYAIFAAAITFTGIYAALRYFRVSYAFIWLLAFFALVNTSEVWRLLLSRPYVLAPTFLVALLVCLHARKPIPAGIISFVYLYWYDPTFFFPLAVTCVYALFDRLYFNRTDWKSIAAVLLGTVAGLASMYLLAPGFFLYMRDVLFGDVSGANQLASLQEGGELYPIDILEYIRTDAILFAGLIVGLFIDFKMYLDARSAPGGVNVSPSSLPAIRGTLLMLIFGFLAAAALVTGRFKDYLLPLIGLYLIIAMSDLVRRVEVRDMLTKLYLMYATCIAVAFLFVASAFSLNSFIADNGSPVEVLEGTGNWLATHTNPGDIVFDASWNWFPQLYYWSPKNNYVIGLEPRFLYDYSPRLYWLWDHIATSGYVCDTDSCPGLQATLVEVVNHPDGTTAIAWYKQQGDAIAASMTQDFKSSYIVSSYQYTILNTVLDHNTHFTKVYGGNRTYYIYKVTP